MTKSWIRIAHRGASGHAPEHSAAAFRRAVALGAQMVELDVHLSRDEKLVVIHDHDVARTTSGTGATRDLSLAEIKRLDAGVWFAEEYRGERVLTLAEVIELLPPQVALNVELKATPADWPTLARLLTDLLSATGRADSTVVSSFAADALRAVRVMSERLSLGVLTHVPNYDEAYELCDELRAVAIHPFFPFVDESMVSESHRRGLRVYVWTVNEEDAIRRLVAAGVDGVISDFPDRLLRVAETFE